VIAGCGSDFPGGRDSDGHGDSNAGSVTIGTTQQGHEREAAAYAERLTTDGPQVAGETPLTEVPARLKHPDQTIGVDNLIIRERYWSVAGSPLHLYRALKEAPVKHLRLSGWGQPGAGGSGNNYADLFYTGTDVPSYLADAELYVEILGRSDGTTDIAAFAEVVPYPTKQSDEVVPAHGAEVVVSRIKDYGGSPLRRVTLTPAKAHRLVTAFDAAKVSPPGICIGGPPPAFGYAAKMTAAGHTWRIVWNGVDNCDALTVKRGQKSLPNIQTTPKLLGLLKTDVAGPDGFIDGGLYKVQDDSLIPLVGKVTLSRGGRVVATFRTHQQGAYEFIVAPGRYRLTGSSADFKNGTATCGDQHRAHVRTGRTSYDEVRCHA